MALDMTTTELFHLRDQALSLVGAKPSESEARIRVLREMFDAGLEAMAVRLAAAQAEADKLPLLAEELARRDEELSESADRERLQTLRITSLRGELDLLRDETAALRAAREAADAEARMAQERTDTASYEAAAARSETEVALRRASEERTRAEIATSEAASAKVE